MADKKKDKLRISPLFVFPNRPPITVPGSINESRRAQALLRNLYRYRDTYTKPSGTRVTLQSMPAIGRTVRSTETPPIFNRKTPTTVIGFTENRNYSHGDAPFRGGLRDAKLQGLLYQLGDIFNRAPSGTISGEGIDQQRRNAYNRFTGGVLDRVTGEAFRRPDGRFMPRDERGRFGTAKPNPGPRLQSGLSRLAAGDVVRTAAPYAMRLLNIDPRIQAAVNADQMLRDATGKGSVERVYDALTEFRQVTGANAPNPFMIP